MEILEQDGGESQIPELTPEQSHTIVVSYLRSLEGPMLPLEIDAEIRRLRVSPVTEVVPYRVTADGRIEILMLTRSPNDSVWPGKLHVPGGIQLPSSEPGRTSLQESLTRVLGKIGNITVSDPEFINYCSHHTARGDTLALVFCAEVTSISEGYPGNFIDIDELSKIEGIIPSQLDFLLQAIQHIREREVLKRRTILSSVMNLLANKLTRLAKRT